MISLHPLVKCSKHMHFEAYFTPHALSNVISRLLDPNEFLRRVLVTKLPFRQDKMTIGSKSPIDYKFVPRECEQ